MVDISFVVLGLQPSQELSRCWPFERTYADTHCYLCNSWHTRELGSSVFKQEVVHNIKPHHKNFMRNISLLWVKKLWPLSLFFILSLNLNFSYPSLGALTFLLPWSLKLKILEIEVRGAYHLTTPLVTTKFESLHTWCLNWPKWTNSTWHSLETYRIKWDRFIK